MLKNANIALTNVIIRLVKLVDIAWTSLECFFRHIWKC